VVDAYSLPLDSTPILALAGRGAAVITVEDNYVGGLGGELAEAEASAGDEAPHVQALCTSVGMSYEKRRIFATIDPCHDPR
jgi:transketolase